MKNLDKILIETGDVVELKQPYKSDDFKHNPSFLAALNNGVLPENPTSWYQFYKNWQGFTHGIVSQIVSRNSDGSPRTISLFLYYVQENGTWLMYSYRNGIPLFVDFWFKEVKLIHKSSASNYNTGEVIYAPKIDQENNTP